MKWVSDPMVHRLREAIADPDLSGTRYRLAKRIAVGGMGTVYLAEDTTLGRNVALKVLDTPDEAGELAERMMREARIVAALEHPGIVPVHDVGTLQDGHVFYTMKYVQGRRLDDHLPSVPSLPDRLRIFQKVCEAVAFAHAHGVIHRDLKPGNIMVGLFGEVLVMDWGVAKVLEGGGEVVPAVAASPASGPAPSGTAHGSVIGTPGYMSPEQERGESRSVDARSDIYALGAVLYFLLTGRTPFRSPEETDALAQPRQLNPKVSKALEAVCLKAMMTDPAERYASARDLAGDIARQLDGEPVTAYRESIVERIDRWIARNRFLLFLILAYLLMRIILILWSGS